MSALFDHPDLKLLHLRVEGVVQSPIIWRSYPGSVVHGALGFHLKRLNCVVSHGRCATCFLNEPHAGGHCAYGALYEPKPPPGSSRMRKYDRTPSPLRLAVHPWLPVRLEAGASLQLELTLVANAVDRAVPLLLALREALGEGLGSKTGQSSRGVVEIQSLTDAWTGLSIPWGAFDPARGLPFAPMDWKELLPFATPGTIRFTSPVRLVSGGRVQAQPSFRSLISVLTRRVTSLAYFGAGMEIEADYRSLLDRAGQLPVKSCFQRVPVQRYSSRQKAEMALDGVLGTMELPQGAGEFLPWLAVGQRVGVGKGTGMGMGGYQLEV